jgi:hypothetical protein
VGRLAISVKKNRIKDAAVHAVSQKIDRILSFLRFVVTLKLKSHPPRPSAIAAGSPA